MDEFRNTPDFNEEDDLIELVDENGETTVFEHLATLEYEGESYLALCDPESEEDDLYLLFRTDPALSLEKTGEGVYRAPISSLSKILERLPAKSGKYQVEPLSALSEGEMKAVVKKCEEEGAGYFDPYDRDYLAPLCLCARKNKTVESMLLTKRGNREDELFLAYVYSRSPMALADVMKKAISVALTLPEEIRFFRFVSIDATAKNIADKLLPEAESAGSTYMAMLDR